MKRYRFITSILYCLAVLFSLLMVSCSAAPSGTMKTSTSLVVAVWDGAIAQRVQKFADIYTRTTGEPVIVDDYPEWQYHGLVEARLLAGTSQWDVLYLDGRWVPELSRENALADLRTLLVPGQERWTGMPEFQKNGTLAGVPVDGRLPYLFYRKDQISGEVIDAINTPEDYFGLLEKLTLPPGESISGAALGDKDAYLSNILLLNAYSHYTSSQSFLNYDLKSNLSRLCNIPSQRFYALESTGWGEGDLVTALRNGNIALAILWSDTGSDLLECSKDSPTCKNGESLIGFRTFPSLIQKDGGGLPRMMNAWVVPGQRISTAAASWLRWVLSSDGEKTWQDLGGVPPGNADSLVYSPSLSITDSVKTLFNSADPVIGLPESDALQANINLYLHECAIGNLSPQKLVENYNHDVLSLLKKSGFAP